MAGWMSLRLAALRNWSRRRERLMRLSLTGLPKFFFMLYDTPDRVQHMMWASGIGSILVTTDVSPELSTRIEDTIADAMPCSLPFSNKTDETLS